LLTAWRARGVPDAQEIVRRAEHQTHSSAWKTVKLRVRNLDGSRIHVAARARSTQEDVWQPHTMHRRWSPPIAGNQRSGTILICRSPRGRAVLSRAREHDGYNVIVSTPKRKKLPASFRTAWAIGVLTCVALAVAAGLLVPASSGTAHFWIGLGALALGGAVCGIVGFIVAFRAPVDDFPPIDGDSR
jgi:hypothetical protein